MATLSTKGQLTIPKKIRDALKLKAGDKVEFVLTNNKVAILRLVSKSIDDVFGKLKRPDKQAESIKEIDSAIKKWLRDQYIGYTDSMCR